MPQTPNNKEAWLKLLKQTAIPSFSANIKTLSSVESYSSSHSSELARTILKDPNLTASVLKLANSVHFNRYSQAIRTVSRSIMLLGHKSIKEVCASCLLMDQFLKKGASNRMQDLLVRAFHAAIQAKEFALMRGQKNTEEIFISALLLSLGELSVYSTFGAGNELSQKINAAYPITGGKEKEIIGCYFTELTLGLCQSWNIAPMIGEMLSGKYAENSPVRSILLGNSFSSTCEQIGLQGALEKHLKSITRYTGKSPEQVTDKIMQASEETQESLGRLGIKSDIILDVPGKTISDQQAFEIKIDKIAQLDIIQELSLVVQEKIDINLVLQQLLEGIKRGGGFRSVLVALLSPDRKRIAAKHSIEPANGRAKENFNFNCYQDIPELHQKVMNNRQVIRQTSLRENGATLKQVMKRTGSQNALWGPLVVENKVIGCFYANNGEQGPQVSTEQEEAFQLFVHQSGLLLHQLK